MACDPFQMVLIHQAFRAQFGALPDLISGVAADDTARAERVGSHLFHMITVLHHHHAAEDDVLWPRLLERAPFGERDVRQAVNEHDGVSVAIDNVLSLRTRWLASAHPSLTERLAARVDALATELSDHLDYEEKAVVPLIEQWIAPEEWQMFIDRGGAYVKPSNLRFALAFAGFVLDEATPDEQQRFMKSVPFVPRMLLKLFGGRASKSYRMTVSGGV